MLSSSPKETGSDRGRAPADVEDAQAALNRLQEQLGLRLEPSKTWGQILVIDAIERPTEN